MLRRHQLAAQGLDGLLRPDLPGVGPAFKGGDTLALIGLRQRAQEARDARNRSLYEQYGPGASFAYEREDPNMGTMSLLSQGLDEAGSRVRFLPRKVLF